MDIFSNNLITGRKPYRYPKATHWHLRHEGPYEAEETRFKSQGAALRVCPEGYKVEGCAFTHSNV